MPFGKDLLQRVLRWRSFWYIPWKIKVCNCFVRHGARLSPRTPTRWKASRHLLPLQNSFTKLASSKAQARVPSASRERRKPEPVKSELPKQCQKPRTCRKVKLILASLFRPGFTEKAKLMQILASKISHFQASLFGLGEAVLGFTFSDSGARSRVSSGVMRSMAAIPPVRTLCRLLKRTHQDRSLRQT